jgi:hypothetical protein
MYLLIRARNVNCGTGINLESKILLRMKKYIIGSLLFAFLGAGTIYAGVSMEGENPTETSAVDKDKDKDKAKTTAKEEKKNSDTKKSGGCCKSKSSCEKTKES